MGKGKAPRPPDPYRTAQAQSQYNRQAAYDSAALNQVNQQTPWGSTYWTGTIGGPDRTQHTVLSPDQQRLFGAQSDTGAMLMGILTGQHYGPDRPTFDLTAPVEADWQEGGRYYQDPSAPTGGRVPQYIPQMGAGGMPVLGSDGMPTMIQNPNYRPDPNVFAAQAPFGSYEEALADYQRQLAEHERADADWLSRYGPDADRGLIGDIGDVLSGPIDFGALQGIDLSQFQGLDLGALPAMPGLSTFGGFDTSGFQALDPASAALIRERGGLASNIEDALGIRRGELGSRQSDIAMVHDAYGRRLGADARRQQGADMLDFTHRLAGPGDFGAERSAVESATFERAMRLLAPEFERQESALMTDLANRGIPITSEAFGGRYGEFADRRDRAFTDTALAAVLAGGGEHSRLSGLAARNRAQLFGEGGQRFAEAGRLFQDARDVFDDRGDIFAAGGDVFGETVAGNRFMEALNQAGEAEQQRLFGRQLATRQQQFDEARYMTDRDDRNAQTLFGQQQALRAMGLSEQQAAAMLANQNAGNVFNQQQTLRQQGLAEAEMARTQPLMDLMRLLGGVQQPSMPQFPGLAQYNVQAPNFMGMVGNNYASQANMWGQRAGGMMSLFGQLGGAAIPFLF